MVKSKIILAIAVTSFLSAAIISCKENNRQAQKSEVVNTPFNKDTLESQAWHMEEQYWKYVGNNDTLSYKSLWHDDFIGYPSFGNGVSNKSGIASWIPELHKDTSLIYSYQLNKKAVNAIGGVVLVFYDADETWTDKASNKVVKKETLKVTHTWKKYDNKWLILGGMAADKR